MAVRGSLPSDSVAQFLTESYLPRGGPIDSAEAIVRLRAAAERGNVRYVRSIVVPGDETCFHVFEGPSPEAVAEVGVRAGLPFDRVTEALESLELEAR